MEPKNRSGQTLAGARWTASGSRSRILAVFLSATSVEKRKNRVIFLEEVSLRM
jgi:hypothetical protein